MGLCNCGFLAQQVTAFSKTEIHSFAMQRDGDWSEQLNDYCPSSRLPMDQVIARMLEVGFALNDLRHLERLSSPVILQQLPVEKRNLRHNVKEDVVKYLEMWADYLELQLLPEPEIEFNVISQRLRTVTVYEVVT